MPDSTDRAAGAQPRKRVALARVHDHPSNPNVMSDDRLEQLTARIDQSGRYPPLIVRNHPLSVTTTTSYSMAISGHGCYAASDTPRPRWSSGSAAMMKRCNYW